MEKIIIDFNGWISVDKMDLKVQSINSDGDLVDFDTTALTAKEVINLLNNGEIYLKSFGETYLNALDGEEDNSFEFEID